MPARRPSSITTSSTVKPSRSSTPAATAASPLAYLARWRLQLAARLLQTTRQPVLQVAIQVGYESEAAFNRAFKREFALAPGQFRKTAAGNGRAEAAQRPLRRDKRTSEPHRRVSRWP
jgi:AraC-like DNA-binding protein